MTDEFGQEFWETHWKAASDSLGLPAHPALHGEIAGLHPGTALDAGSGEGAEAIWLADHGWVVTAVDISSNALRRASATFKSHAGAERVSWVHADLTEWEPTQKFDLVTTFYAHPAMPQHAFYKRISDWVAPGGTLFIVGHHDDSGNVRSHAHPENAVTEPKRIRALLDPTVWKVLTAELRERTLSMPTGKQATLRDVIIRAERT